MSIVSQYFRDLRQAVFTGWNRFWFTPVDPATFCMIRLLGGLMIFYTHLVWTLGLEDFFGPHPWLSAAALSNRYAEPSTWSHLWMVDDSPLLLWVSHIVCLVILALFAVGWKSRITSVLTFLIVASYALRVPAAQFGLDHVNGMIAFYLMFGPSGACYSVDAWLQRRRQGANLRRRREAHDVQPSVGANIGIRLLQLHMCVMYLFAGLGKLQGPTWWNGTAIWYAVASLEYQSLDLTALAWHPYLANFLTHISVWWEVTYAALVWPRLSRPLVIALAVPLHLGIALGLGMITFGLAMLIANMAFIAPWLTRAAVDGLAARLKTQKPATEV